MGTSLDRFTFGDDARIYTDYDDLWLPSVSMVLSMREKAPGFRNWLKRTSEAEQNQTKFYTSNRGTLIHYELLSQLVDYEFWSEDEQASKDQLRGREVDDETGLTGDYETWERYQEDEEWAKEAWTLIRRVYGIEPDSVLEVEHFVTNTDVGYAGQFDLLYVDDEGDVVLADIKTSKRVYDKHLVQAVAYMHAVDITVDEIQIIRINPDSKTWEVSSSDDWLDDLDELWEEFKSLRRELGEERIREVKERVDDLEDTDVDYVPGYS